MENIKKENKRQKIIMTYKNDQGKYSKSKPNNNAISIRRMDRTRNRRT